MWQVLCSVHPNGRGGGGGGVANSNDRKKRDFLFYLFLFYEYCIRPKELKKTQAVSDHNVKKHAWYFQHHLGR